MIMKPKDGFVWLLFDVEQEADARSFELVRLVKPLKRFLRARASGVSGCTDFGT